jgi:DNA-binding NarL/FixJ family response regulator
MIRELGWNTLEASSGEQALHLYDKHRSSIDIVLLDQQMPGLSGTEVSLALWRRDPGARILLSSGHSEEFVREDMVSGGCIAGFLQKPYSLTELSLALQLAYAAAT